LGLTKALALLFMDKINVTLSTLMTGAHRIECQESVYTFSKNEMSGVMFKRFFYTLLPILYMVFIWLQSEMPIKRIIQFIEMMLF